MLGAFAGIIFTFVAVKEIPVRLISLIVLIAGGIYVLVNCLNIGGLGKSIVKGFESATQTGPGTGLFVIIAGWIVAVAGYIKSRG